MVRQARWVIATLLAVTACGEPAPIENSGGSESTGSSSTSGSQGAGGTSASGPGGSSSAGGSSGGTARSGSGGSADSGSGGSVSSGGSAGSDSSGGASGSAGAGGSSGSDPSGGTGGVDSDPFDYPIDPAALEGCRSPEEPGCLECCVGPTEDGNCDYLNGDTDWSQNEVDPWYFKRGVKDGPCPESCPKCAQCSIRAEEGLRKKVPRPECDCEGVEQMGDDCYVQSSCQCYCVQVQSLMETCPPAP